MDDKNQMIMQILRDIETEYNVVIIFAVCVGSRASGIHIETSDYDIRFVFVTKDQIKYTLKKNLGTITKFSKDAKYDCQGWDIMKTIELMQQSNSSLVEWLQSPLILIDRFDFRSNSLKIIKQMHTHVSLMYHYYHMAKRNWSDWITDQTDIIFKKYFQIIIPTASLHYIMNEYDKHPDESLQIILNLEELLSKICHDMPEQTYSDILHLIDMKRQSSNTETIKPIQSIHDWFNFQMNRFNEKTSDEKQPDIRLQGIIKLHNKLKNETDKIIAITKVAHHTARSNYLSGISTAMQLLFLIKNPSHSMSDIPQKLIDLINAIDIDDKIKNEIIVLEKSNNETELDCDNITGVNFGHIYNHFIKSGFDFLGKEINSTDDNIYTQLNLSQEMIDGIIASQTKPKRNDIVEFVLKNFINTLWILANNDESSTNIPKDIINKGDKTKTIPNELITLVKSIIAKLKFKTVSESNSVINEWLLSICKSSEPIVNNVRRMVAEIDKINTENRYKKSLVKVSEDQFDNIVIDIIKQIHG